MEATRASQVPGYAPSSKETLPQGAARGLRPRPRGIFGESGRGR